MCICLKEREREFIITEQITVSGLEYFGTAKESFGKTLPVFLSRRLGSLKIELFLLCLLLS